MLCHLFTRRQIHTQKKKKNEGGLTKKKKTVLKSYIHERVYLEPH